MDKPDLMELIPVRLFDWETDPETDRVIIVRPKFTSSLAQKIIMPFYGQKFFKIKLDALGSLVWRMSDGEHTVGEILEALQKEFTEEEELTRRLTLFIHQLVREKFIQLLQRVDESDSAQQA